MEPRAGSLGCSQFKSSGAGRHHRCRASLSIHCVSPVSWLLQKAPGLCNTGWCSWFAKPPSPSNPAEGRRCLGVLLVELQGAVLTVGWGGTRTAQSLGLPVTHREQGSHSCAWPGRTGQESAPWAFPRSWERPSHGPEPAALGTRGQGRARSVTLGPAMLREAFCACPTTPMVRHLQFLSKILYFLGIGKGKGVSAWALLGGSLCLKYQIGLSSAQLGPSGGRGAGAAPQT